jgi:hypothetical protein
MKLASIVSVLLLSVAARAAEPFVFRDLAEAAGLFPEAAGIHGHGAAWGDVDGDGWIDLLVGTFHKPNSKPTMFFHNQRGKFEFPAQAPLAFSAQVTGVVFADLDNDGDLDLYVGSMPQPRNQLIGCALFRNDGRGVFTDISRENGACPTAFGGRGVAVVDYDGDGLLDLLVGEDPLPGYNGSPTRSTRLFHNLGGLRFEDASRAAGLPDTPGLGVAAGDFNNDGWPDLFIAAASGNVLCLNDGHGHFSEPPGARAAFAWPDLGRGDMIAGVCCGDVNRDGLLDVLIGQHFKSPWTEPAPIRLYLSRGVENGVPKFEDVTVAAGLVPLSMKAPHVEIQDMDNDGWPDLVTSMVMFREGAPHPVIFRHLGLKNGEPRFTAPALSVNDFPTEADRNVKRPSALFSKAQAEGKVTYMAAAPSGDYDNDGRLDLFLPAWWPEGRSLLLHNETPGGHWLDVQIEGSGAINRMGLGCRIQVYRAGHLGEAGALLGARELAVGYGYAAGQPAIAHFGLGSETTVDLQVTLPHGRGTLVEKGVLVDRRHSIAVRSPANR